MNKFQYIEDFKKLGLGMFVHFGLYSQVGKGEWRYTNCPQEEKDTYFDRLPKTFKIKKGWAKELVKTAKDAGCKYITLTTRHHEGFSLFDTCGLNDYDALHTPTGRDLIREYVDECNKQGIIPFFYHTLLDWHHPDYDTNFPSYIDYLVKSVEILCKNYGKVGGFWFDGFWNKPDADWQFDRLYKTIRKYQPDAMIINNTGLNSLGEVSHPEIDSVTFERGKPSYVDCKDKPRAGEMCDGITDHWGYTALDVCTKSTPTLIKDMIICRGCDCNYLINTGLKGDGSVNPIEKYTLKNLGLWIKQNKKFIYNVVKAEFEAENAIILKDDKFYYAVCFDVPMVANENVQRVQNCPTVNFPKEIKPKNLVWLESGAKIPFDRKSNSFQIKGFPYGVSLYARVARFKVK